MFSEEVHTEVFEERALARGDFATIHGLVSRPELNGTDILLLHYAPVSGRWRCRIKVSGEILRIRSCNVRPMPRFVLVDSTAHSSPQHHCRSGPLKHRASPPDPDALQCIEAVLEEFLSVRFMARLKVTSSVVSRSICVAKRLFVCGLWCPPGKSSWPDWRMSLLDLRTGLRSWVQPLVPRASERRQATCSAVLGRFVYVCGGLTMSSGGVGRACGTAERYDSRTGQWEELPRMLSNRHAGSAIAFGGLLYVIGGCDNHFSVLSAVESYDPKDNSWSREPYLRQARFLMATIICEGQIYAIGGHPEVCSGQFAHLPSFMKPATVRRDTPSLSSAERFCPGHIRWETLPSMSKARCAPATAAIAGAVYVCGGWDGEPLSSAERYLVASDEWQALPSMSECRSRASAAMDTVGRIYIIGGNNGSAALGSVERFDAESHTWQAVASMNRARMMPLMASSGRFIYACSSTDAECLDTKRNVWTTLEAAPAESDVGSFRDQFGLQVASALGPADFGAGA